MRREESKTEHRTLGHTQIEQGVRGGSMSQWIPKRSTQTNRKTGAV